MLKREGEDPAVSEKFYRAVVQAVLLFGAEILVLTIPLMQKLEGVHVILIWQVTRKHETRRRDGYWLQVTTEVAIQGEGKQFLRTYVDRQHATVAEWVDLRPILTFVRERRDMREGGDSQYRGGGKRQCRIN